MKPRHIARKFLAVAGLFALLTTSMSTLAESLSASELPVCCNTVYCPLHHRQGHDTQKDKSDCGAPGNPRRTDSSMRACDSVPNQAVGTAPFLLAAPVTISREMTTQAAPLSTSRFFPFLVRIPSTPPPRTLP